MNLLTKNIFVASVFLMFLTGNVEGTVRVLAQVDTSKDIYVGENFVYHIIIDGENKAGRVDITPLAKYNPRSIGNRDVSQTSINFINGKTTQNIKKQYVMSYSLVHNQAGKLYLPPVTVTLDGNSYQTNPLEVNIIKPGTTDQLDLEVTLSERQCYVGQPVLMTVKFYVSADIGDFQLNIPAFTSGDFYVEDPDKPEPQAREYDLGNGIIVNVAQYRTVHNGKQSILLSFSKILIPKRSGDIAISPSSVSADVVVGRAHARDSIFDDFLGSRKEYKRFMVKSQPLSQRVLPLPEEGKPSGFYGLVGRYTISASARPTNVNVGDPITLTIKIGGGKYLKPVEWPALEQVPEMVDNFKIPSEKASPTIEDGYKIFTQTIRASNDGVSEIPSIPLAYFDADKGRYEVAKTEAIKLEVSPTKILTNADLEGRDFDFAPVNSEVEAIKKGLSANYEDIDALTNQRFSPLTTAITTGYLVIWAGPLAVLVLSALIKFFTYTTPEKIAARRQRTAAAQAISRLKQITSVGDEERHELLSSIMKQYLGERFNRTARSLTSNDCFEIIAQATKASEIANRYKEIIANCEAARYASVENNVDAVQVAEVTKLIRDIDRESGK